MATLGTSNLAENNGNSLFLEGHSNNSKITTKNSASKGYRAMLRIAKSWLKFKIRFTYAIASKMEAARKKIQPNVIMLKVPNIEINSPKEGKNRF